jgi:phage baseplate assembly protein W
LIWTVQNIDSLTGTGTYDPMDVDITGSVMKEAGVYDIEMSIKRILTTRLGERVMLPTYGSNLWKYLFEPLTPMNKDRIKSCVINSLALWEPRIQLTQFGVFEKADPGVDQNTLIFVMYYRILGTSDEQKVSIPINTSTLSFEMFV